MEMKEAEEAEIDDRGNAAMYHKDDRYKVSLYGTGTQNALNGVKEEIPNDEDFSHLPPRPN